MLIDRVQRTEYYYVYSRDSKRGVEKMAKTKNVSNTKRKPTLQLKETKKPQGESSVRIE